MEEKVKILNELKELGAPALLMADNKNYFDVPVGYFDTLPGVINANVFLSSFHAANPYTIPDDYFKNLPELIMDKVAVSFNDRELPYSVPNDYFKNLPGVILGKIRSLEVENELESISPFLKTLSKENIYSVPGDYFTETNPLNSIHKPGRKPAKVLSIFSNASGWLKYAIAACIVALLFGGGYMYISNNKPVITTAQVPVIDIQKQISLLSDDEITNYLKSNTNIAVYIGTNPDNSQFQNADIQTLLQNVSDEEIEQYLKENQAPGENGGGI